MNDEENYECLDCDYVTEGEGTASCHEFDYAHQMKLRLVRR